MFTLTNVHSVLLGVTLSEDSILQALIYSAIGIALFGAVFFLIVKIAPFSIRKEIEDDQNTALGIIIGSVIIGISLIISAAIQG